MFKKLLLGLLFATLLATGAVAQGVATGKVTTAAPSYTNGTIDALSLNTAGGIRMETNGGVASGAADSGNPVKMGCVFQSTAPNVSTGQRVDVLCTNSGGIVVGTRTTGADATTNTLVAPNGASAGGTNGSAPMLSAPLVFNGTTWDRDFTCTSTAVVNVTAGNTTQIVALNGSTVIRVCSVAISMSAAGTATFVYGTGANCGTGTTAITGAMPLATGTPLELSGMNGSVLRGLAANALCVTAATGNVVGWITYAQY